jgi:hypothetical protein
MSVASVYQGPRQQNPLCVFAKSSIGRKWIVGISGALLILFVLAHLAGNLTIYIVESSWFEPLIALTILCNVTTMAINSPLDPEGTEKAAFISKCEIVYLAIFLDDL